MSAEDVKSNKRPDLPWYSGVNLSSLKDYGAEAEILCSSYIQVLFVSPQSRAVELVLETIETHRDAQMVAQCLSDAMAYIAHTPIGRIKDQLVSEQEHPDYSTTHNFDHTQEELRRALHMTPDEFEATLHMVTIISGEMFKAGLKKTFEVSIDPTHAAHIFEKVLKSSEWTPLQKAAALYMFLAMPIKQELTVLEKFSTELAKKMPQG
ncbi:MAG TPA: hypothetical protein VF790_10235 [Dissulfurispiraceae bacterium]